MAAAPAPSPAAPPAVYRVAVGTRPGRRDPRGESALAALREAGLEGARVVRFQAVYLLETDAPRAAVERAAREFLADPVLEEAAVDAPVRADEERLPVLTVLRRPGVMDPVESSVREALGALGIRVLSVRTGRRYVVEGGVPAEAAARAAARALANEVIEEVHRGVDLPVRLPHPRPYEFRRVEVPLRAANDAALERISREGGLGLALHEMRAVRDHFERVERREPTDAELETLAQTWSEHCKHKTLAGPVRMRDAGGERRYGNLLRETIVKATETLARDWCLSVFVDNAGVVALDERYGVCMKVETHNHPSAIEPYGGAGTGVGGVIRDVLGTGLGARPFLCTDVFCLAPPDLPADRVPRGALHPRRVLRGVVAGVRDYGNRMGIPTASGALWFDERFVGNPLVFCGTVGLLPRGLVHKAARDGDRVVVAGGRTGRDGIHGATFSSAALREDSERVDAGAVQIGNPIEEKRLADGLLRARDEGLYHSVTDCGAGGLSSAVGEMGAELGAQVHLDRVPTKYPGLSYTEVWISEAQERMVFAVPPENLPRLREVFAGEGVEVTDLGTFERTGRLRLSWHGQPVADLPMEFLHEGLPRLEREARWEAPPPGDPPPETADHAGELRAMLSHENVCSREAVVRQYDHEVQGGSALKPFAGPRGIGPSDAVAAAPLETAPRGVVVACGLNPGYSDLDPYAMATAAIDEAVRNAVAVGADPDRIALLDNFCWADARRPEELGGLVRAAEACRDSAIALGTPWISGKDSLHNEFDAGGRRISIPGTLLVSALGVVDDVERLVSMEFKRPGSAVYLLGTTRDERGATLLARRHGARGGTVPRGRPEESLPVFRALHRAIRGGLVRAAHDLSDGGLAVALGECCLAGDLGAVVRLTSVPWEGPEVTDGALLYSESCGRFLVEVAPESAADFERETAGLPRARVGETAAEARLTVLGLRGAVLLEEPVEALREAFLRRLPA